MVNTDRLCMGCMNDNGGEKVCPICGHDSSLDNPSQYLSIGTWLNGNRYLTGKVLEENGDCAVYIGWDNDINAVVRITEYLPEGIARRSADRLTVSPAPDRGMAFNSGMEEFIQLYTRLSKITAAPSLLAVTDVFESNGTVYAVSNTVSSITLKDFLLRNGGTLKWEQIKALIMPLISTLAVLHDADIVHRGISPETILVGRDGRLYLSGFAIKSARCANTDFVCRLASGYAAPEQYDAEGESGAASDIYAVGAVIFRCMIGSTPPDAKERMSNDRLSIPANITETVSKGALVAVANALKVDAEARTSSADRFKKMLEAAASALPTDAPETAKPAKKAKNNSSAKKYAIISSLITAVIFTGIIIAVVLVSPGLFGGESEESGYSSITPPSTAQVGDVDPNVSADPDEKTYEVPNYKGKTYSEITEDINPVFEIVIAGKQYSDSVERGHVVDQTVKAGTQVVRDTEIGVYISLGPSTIKMPDLLGLDKDSAYIVLLEYGFLPENIEFRERVAADLPGVVIATSVKAGDSISLDDAIIVDYCPEATESVQ